MTDRYRRQSARRVRRVQSLAAHPHRGELGFTDRTRVARLHSPSGMATPRSSFSLTIDTHRCTGCGWCVAACPLNLLSLEVKHWKKTSVAHDLHTCTGCRQCEFRCPFQVITVVRQGRDLNRP